MERIFVNSKNIRSVGCDEVSRVLEVEFNSGAVYQYFSVAPAEYDGFMSAGSKGGYFQANIRDKYSFVKL